MRDKFKKPKYIIIWGVWGGTRRYGWGKGQGKPYLLQQPKINRTKTKTASYHWKICLIW
jgi:hypothetical protein